MSIDSTIVAGLIGLIGAVIGAAITGYFVLAQTSKLLKEENKRNELERERETKSVATALFWEIDYFYKMNVSNACRALSHSTPSELGWYVKSVDLKAFTVFESTADKVGLFEPELVRFIVGFYGNARTYMNTLIEYKAAMEKFTWLRGNEFKPVAVTLLDDIKKASATLVPTTQILCEALAKRSGAKYTFEAP
jgi:hypothetical protein